MSPRAPFVTIVGPQPSVERGLFLRPMTSPAAAGTSWHPPCAAERLLSTAGPVTPGDAPVPFGVAVSRDRGTVVVTVHGYLDLAGAQHLDAVLADLIDGQGNLAVVIDLHDAGDAGMSVFVVSVFAGAAKCASRRGATLSLRGPPPQVHQALQLLCIEGLVATTRDARPASGSAEPHRSARSAGEPRSHVHRTGDST